MMGTATDNHPHELLPAFALDSLDDDETRQVTQHLARCSACNDELRSYQWVTDRLPLAVPEVVPPAHVKQRLMHGIAPGGRAPRARRSWWERPAFPARRAVPVWGLVSLILIAALAVGNLWLWRQGSPRQKPGEMQIVALRGTEAAPQATGRLVISSDGEYGTLVVEGLPALGESLQYQLWLIRDGQRTSGGVFSVNPEGYGAVVVSSPRPLSDYTAFGITIEPAGGSPGPTGDRVLAGTL